MVAANRKRVPGTLIVAGIGAAEPLDALLKDLGGVPERVFLIEPAETAGGAHAQGLAALDGVDVIDGVMADAAGKAELVRYNLPGLRSLSAPTDALRVLFPGLKERARVGTRLVPAAQVIGDAGALPAPVRLRIDLPGAEPMILQALEDRGTLEHVELLSLRCGAETPFKGGWERARLQSWLEARYFSLDHAVEDDPDWPELLLKVDPAARRIAALEAELARAAAEAETLRKDLSETAKTAKARESELAETEAARAKLESELAKTREDAATEAETLRKAASDTAEKLKALEDVQDRLKDRETALEKTQATLEARNKALKQVKQAAARDAERIRRLEAECSTARHDLSLSLQSQSGLRAEIEDLRGRHASLFDEKTELETLIQQLTPRLQEASSYLREISLPSGTADSNLEQLATTSRNTRKQAGKTGK